ncbi:hypothetical protein PJL18_04334 [Paenarthrobacter nicotinovorans]|nr:hypothetical protein [Paenarthrobacter nicotinovorans]
MFRPGGEDRAHELPVGLGELPENACVVCLQKLREFKTDRGERDGLRYLEKGEVVGAARFDQGLRYGVEVGSDAEPQCSDLGVHEPADVGVHLRRRAALPKEGQPGGEEEFALGQVGRGVFELTGFHPPQQRAAAAAVVNHFQLGRQLLQELLKRDEAQAGGGGLRRHCLARRLPAPGSRGTGRR